MGRNYNLYMVVSWMEGADTYYMKNFQNAQNTYTSFRDAFGPGFQAGGPSDATLRMVLPQPKPHTS
ncbi:MAG: hypothetical protein ACI81L_002444 [Verrucomicrobiales bacterium]|jgi:hypothetical protein